MRRKPLLVNIRGTSGSGKSTIVHKLMRRFPTEKLNLDRRGKPNNYLITLPSGRKLFVVGRYETQCGGCDQVGSWQETVRRIDEHLKKHPTKHDVIFEGLLISNVYGGLGEWSEKFGNRMIFAYLNTKLETCLKRVQARRDKRGVTKPFNPKHTIAKWKAVRTNRKLVESKGRRTATIHTSTAVQDVLDLLGETQ